MSEPSTAQRKAAMKRKNKNKVEPTYSDGIRRRFYQEDEKGEVSKAAKGKAFCEGERW